MCFAFFTELAIDNSISPQNWCEEGAENLSAIFVAPSFGFSLFPRRFFDHVIGAPKAPRLPKVAFDTFIRPPVLLRCLVVSDAYLAFVCAFVVGEWSHRFISFVHRGRQRRGGKYDATGRC